MLGLEDSTGRWCEGEGEIRDIATFYFAQLFTTSNSTNIAEKVGCVGRRVTSQCNANLTKPVTQEEITRVVKTLNPTKAPGPDGFTGSFVQQFRRQLVQMLVR